MKAQPPGPGIAAARAVGEQLDFGQSSRVVCWHAGHVSGSVRWEVRVSAMTDDASHFPASDVIDKRDHAALDVPAAASIRRSSPRALGQFVAVGRWQRRRAGADRHASSGRRTVNVLPLPSSLSSETSPPSSLHSSLTIDSPSPVPEYSRVMASPPGMAGRALAELLEDRLLVLLGDAHARVAHVAAPGSSARRGAARDRDPAPLGRELDGVGEQVVEDLLHRAWSWCSGGRSGSISVSRSMFFRSVSGRAMSHCAAITWRDAEIGQPDFHLAAFDLGQVEDVVDHLQQRLARLLDVLHVALLLVVQRVDRARARR